MKRIVNIILLKLLFVAPALAQFQWDAASYSSIDLADRGSTATVTIDRAAVRSWVTTPTLATTLLNYALSGHNHAGIYEPAIAASTPWNFLAWDKTWRQIGQAQTSDLRTTSTPTFAGLGIGVAPTAKITVRGSSATDRLAAIFGTSDWTPSVGTALIARLGAATGNTYAELLATTGGYFTVGNLMLTGSSVGVGGTPFAAQAQLHVSGDISATGGLYTGGSTAAKGTLRVDSTGNATLSTATIGQAKDWGRLTAAPSTPVEGDTYYDTTLHKRRTWDGSAWQNHW